jgi:hypothetical protein
LNCQILLKHYRAQEVQRKQDKLQQYKETIAEAAKHQQTKEKKGGGKATKTQTAKPKH